MFTGLVEEIGYVVLFEMSDSLSVLLTISANIIMQNLKLGDSIAVNGVCLTVTTFNITQKHFTLGIAPETLRKTNLGDVKQGDLVNLERSMQPTSKFGGHFVQGHVDGTGVILSFQSEKDSLWVKVKTSPDLVRYIVSKGFIAVDGTSLTVVDVHYPSSESDECWFMFMLVAYTQQKITLSRKKVGQRVNLEVDMMGKYIVNFLDHQLPSYLKAARSKL